MISSEDINNLKLSTDDLKHALDIKHGITLKADVPLPPGSSCSSDPFCVVVKKILPPNTIFHFDSSIVSTTNFQMVASLSGSIPLSRGLTLTHIGLEIQVGEETSIGLIGQIALPNIDFTARIYAAPSGVIMEMIAAGCLYKAFGLPLLDICNIKGSIGFGETLITEISLGGEIRFGTGTCSSDPPLIAAGYIGLNTVEPQKNYFYVNFQMV